MAQQGGDRYRATRRGARINRRCLLLIVALMVVFASAGASVAAPSSRPLPGAGSIGDPLFPTLGNGGYDVGHYTLDLHFGDPGLRQVDATVSIGARATQALSRFDLDFAAGTVSRVAVNGAPAAWTVEGEKLVVTPARALPDRRRFRVRVTYVRVVPQDSVLGWLGNADGLVTFFSPSFAHLVFPCNDHPRDKATYAFHLNVPAGTTAVANGVLTGESTRAGRTEWSYVQREPMTSMLVQIVVGAFSVTRHTGPHGLPLRDVTPRRLTTLLSPTLARTSDQVAWMESKVGRYPFDTYGVLAADENLNFALETQTLSLFPASSLYPPAYEPLMVHELAHQWFGDSVSPKLWRDVWLNEGHATWYQDEYDAEHGGPNLDQVMRGIYAESDALRANGGPVAQPHGGLFQIFTTNVYDGGALTLYALRQKIGNDAFKKVERAWVQHNRNRAADTHDFIAQASQTTDRDLAGFLDAWLYGTTTPPMPGHPDWTTYPAQAPRPTNPPVAETATHNPQRESTPRGNQP